MRTTTQFLTALFQSLACALTAYVPLCPHASAAELTVTALLIDSKPADGVVLTLDAPGLPARPPLHAIVDQVDQRFVPEQIVIPLKSTVEFPNTDAVSHQVYSFSAAKQFQLPLYRGKPYPPQHFDKAGIITLGCNIHDDMIAYVMVTDAPYFGITDAQGHWTARDLPAGTYRLRLWHPRTRDDGPLAERTVTLSASDNIQLNLATGRALRPAPIHDRPHSWSSY